MTSSVIEPASEVLKKLGSISVSARDENDDATADTDIIISEWRSINNNWIRTALCDTLHVANCRLGAVVRKWRIDLEGDSETLEVVEVTEDSPPLAILRRNKKQFEQMMKSQERHPESSLQFCTATQSHTQCQ